MCVETGQIDGARLCPRATILKGEIVYFLRQPSPASPADRFRTPRRIFLWTVHEMAGPCTFRQVRFAEYRFCATLRRYSGWLLRQRHSVSAWTLRRPRCRLLRQRQLNLTDVEASQSVCCCGADNARSWESSLVEGDSPCPCLRMKVFSRRQRSSQSTSQSRKICTAWTSPHMSPKAEEGEVSEADKELLCKHVFVDLSLVSEKGRSSTSALSFALPACQLPLSTLSMRPLGPRHVVAVSPSTLRRKSPGSYSSFVASEPWRLVEIDVGRYRCTLPLSIWRHYALAIGQGISVPAFFIQQGRESKRPCFLVGIRVYV